MRNPDIKNEKKVLKENGADNVVPNKDEVKRVIPYVEHIEKGM